MEIKDDIFREIIGTASDLIKIPSRNPPGEEKACAEYIASRLREMDLEVQVIKEPFSNRPQIIAYNDDPVIMLNGHIDTVPEGDRESWSMDPFSGIVKDGMLYGRGSIDMKSALAIMIHMPRIISRGILLMFAIGEERAEPGTQTLMKYINDIRYGIVLEPTSLAIAPYQRGALWLKITTRGKATHGSLPEHGINAIMLADEIIHKIDDYSRILRERVFIDTFPTCAITMINGGIKENIIPDRCDLVIDRRLIPDEDLDIVKKEIRDMLDNEVEIIGFRKPVRVDNSLLSNILASTMKEVTGHSSIKCFPASSDNEHIVAKGIESIVWGPGDLSKAHAIDEAISIDEIMIASKVLALSLYRLLRELGL